MHSRGLVLIVMLCAASIAACATTEVKSVWKDEAYKAQPKRVLVIAMFKSQTVSMQIEDEFLNHLKSRGVEAVVSYDVFPGKELPTKERVVEHVRGGGYDAVLLTRVINTRTEQRTVQGTPAYAPAPYYAMPMSGYYGYGYTSVYTPRYEVDERYARLESNLYDAATEKLVWTATSDTNLSGGDQELKLIQTFVAIMVESLRKEKIVP